MSGKGAKGLSSGKGAKGTLTGKTGDKKKPVSRSARAGLQFPVGRIHRLLKVIQALSFVFSAAFPHVGAQVSISLLALSTWLPAAP